MGYGGLRPALFIAALCLLVGLPTIRGDNYFLGDDFGLVQHLHDLPFQRLLSYFISDWTEGIYGGQLDELRPFLALSYWMDARLFGATNVAGYHFTNVVLHTSNALLVLAIARSVAPGETGVSLLAGALFAVAPSHTEPLAWISGRVDSLAALSYLGAFLCFVRFRSVQRVRWLLASVAIFVCGLFTKQSLITFPAVVVAYDLFGPTSVASRGRTLSRMAAEAPFLGILALYLALRYQLFGNAVREDSLNASMLTEFVFLRQLFYVMNWLPAISILTIALAIAALALSAIWMWERREHHRPAIKRVVFFGFFWWVITIAPMAVTYASARHLYLTSAGLAIAIASLVLPGPLGNKDERRAARLAIGALLVLLGTASLILSNQRWISSGLESGRAIASMSRLLKNVPDGSVVVLGLPSKRGDVWFWAYALPFALQPPFLAENLYERFRFIEDPRVHCCRDVWWSVKETTFWWIISSPAPTPITFIEPAIDGMGTPLLTTRLIEGQDVKQRLETSIGLPIESFSKLTRLQAQTILPMLME